MIKLQKIIFFILMFNPNILFAFGYSANPTKLVLSKNQKIETLTIENISKEKTSIQIDAVHWDQHNNEEIYLFTKDVIISPKIVTLLPGKSKIIRIGLKRALPNDIEGNYRIILRELVMPNTLINPNAIKGNIRMSLNMSIPLFIEPQKINLTAPYWTIQKINDQKIKLICRNNNNVHLIINDIRLLDKNHHPISNIIKSYRYILPKKEIYWEIPLKENEINNIYKIDSKINNENIAINAFTKK